MAKNVKNQILDSLKWFKAKLTSSIVNNCSSTSTTLPLSAAQGRSLQNQITQQNTNLTMQNITVTQTKYVNSVYYAVKIPAIKIAIISGSLINDFTGIDITVATIDVSASKGANAPINAYNGVDGEIKVDRGSKEIKASISNNSAIGKFLLIFPYN